MRHHLLVEALFTKYNDDFSTWWPMNVVLIFYTFGKIKQMEKTAIMQSPKTKKSFDVKLIPFNRFSVSNLLNIFSLLKTYE